VAFARFDIARFFEVDTVVDHCFAAVRRTARTSRKVDSVEGVLAYHVIFGTYGFWLPNDPRGSGSDFVASWDLFRYGRATKVQTRQSVAGRRHDVACRLQAKSVLKYTPVVLSGIQALEVARAFGRHAKKSDYAIHACAILPDHVHMVFGRHRYRVESMVRLLKAAASTELEERRLHPLEHWRLSDGSVPSPWGRKCWKVYLNSEEDIVRSVRYVEANPLKEGKPAQRWSFVSKYVTPATS
jgi:REP element-mobilizing transposase RayT